MVNKPSLLFKILGGLFTLAFVLFILACISKITAQVFFFFITCVIAFLSLSFVYKTSKVLGTKKYIAGTLAHAQYGSYTPMVINNVEFVICKAPYRYVVNTYVFNKLDDVVEYIYNTAYNKPVS